MKSISRVISIFFLFVVRTACAFGTQNADSLSRLISADSISNFVQLLSSNEFAGRETGREGQKKAAEWIRKKYILYGLEPLFYGDFIQHHPQSVRANGKANFEINQKYFLFGEDYFYFPGYHNSVYRIDSVLFCGYGISEKAYDDFATSSCRGKTILLMEGEPVNKRGKSWITGTNEKSQWSTDWRKKWKLFIAMKPRLVLMVVDNISARIDSFLYKRLPEGFAMSSVLPDSPPVVFISREMALRLFPESHEEILEKSIDRIRKTGKPSTFMTSSDAELRIKESTAILLGENVAGMIRGTGSRDEYLVISAHYDHLGIRDSVLYPGADDNASGMSGLLEIARIFSLESRAGHPPVRNIIFLSVSGEEKGLLGSAWFVKHPPVPEEKIIADLNIDMIGRTDAVHDSAGISDYIYIIDPGSLCHTIDSINTEENEKYTHIVLDHRFNDEKDPNHFYNRSDHYNFIKNHIPAIFYFSGVHADYHKPTDTADKINPDLARARCGLIFLTAFNLANSETTIRTEKP